LGSSPRQGLAKMWAKSEARKSHFMFLGVWENVREWTPTLPNELLLWELESRSTSEFSKSNYKGQNPLDCRVFYIIKKSLGMYMSKMSSHDSFGYLKHKLWPKKGLGVKLSIWLSPTKSQESPQFLCVQVACHISLESSPWGLQLCFRHQLNQRFAHNVIGLQIHKSLNLRNLRLPLESSGTKWHLGASPMAKHIEYYKGEGGGFSQV
jgi:hypothetical protein